MNEQSDIRLLYEWNAKNDQLNFAIQQAEHQLSNVNKRLKGLWHDLTAYGTMIVLPYLIIRIFGVLINFRVMTAFSVIFHHTLLCVYILFLPVNIYNFLKTISILKKNSEQKTEFEQPSLKGEFHGTQPPRERSYRLEQKKLIYILTRYYLNHDIMTQLHKRITDSGSDKMSLAELKLQMDRLPFYEEIRPADEFSDSANKVQMGKSKLIPLFAIGILLLMYILFKEWRM